MPVMNNHGTRSGAIARKDKEFKGIIGTYEHSGIWALISVLIAYALPLIYLYIRRRKAA